jgi:hypothetical protein
VLEFTDTELYDKAVQLGMIGPGGALTAAMAKRVKVALVEERRAAAQPSEDGRYVGGRITIRPGVSIELDGQRLPAAGESVEIHVSADPDTPSTVRLTLLAHTIQTIKE